VAGTDPLAFLFSLERLGMKFGLDNITRLCEALGHPERAFASVHVAGTNGKGSVTAMTEAALAAAGHRTARYTSPHLVRLEERFVIGGEEVATDRLTDAAARVQAIAEDLVRRQIIEELPTFFECATAIAFELFREAGVELAVVEVGLGGRLDATNVITPVAAAITSIDFDHQAQLGSTLASIAREKAGIVKPGVPMVCGPLPPEAAAVIEERCAQLGAPLIHAPRTVTMEPSPQGGRALVRLTTSRRVMDDVVLGLRGRHQADNAAVAVALLDVLDGLGWAVPDAAVRTGLAGTLWPGRLEWFRSGDAEIFVDAAHNPAGARALADHLREAGWDDITLVFGAMRDKDVAGMMGALAPLCGTIICTTPDTPRAMPAAELAMAAAACPDAPAQIHAIDPPADALRDAVALGGRVVVAGSIFLIGPLRDILR
jgi:dihydrofolate synthase/folylpolyglutamate synthase